MKEALSRLLRSIALAATDVSFPGEGRTEDLRFKYRAEGAPERALQRKQSCPLGDLQPSPQQAPQGWCPTHPPARSQKITA